MSNVWAELNERQRAYLQALYDCDQATEAGRREDAARGFYDRTPASEWRWQMYGPVAPPSMFYRLLHDAKLIDPGTGATFQALEDRKLVQCRYVPDAFGVRLLQVQITPLGRKVIRAATGAQRLKAPPKGQLRERQWAALAQLYTAGEEGVSATVLEYGPGGFDWWRTLRRLEEYKPARLIESYRTPWADNGDGTAREPESRWRITSFGRDYYEREWARYRELYPDVEAPEPEDA